MSAFFVCDPNDSLFEPTLAWLNWLMKVYQKKDEELDYNGGNIKSKQPFDVSDNPKVNLYANAAIFELVENKGMSVEDAYEEIKLGVPAKEAVMADCILLFHKKAESIV